RDRPAQGPREAAADSTSRLRGDLRSHGWAAGHDPAARSPAARIPAAHPRGDRGARQACESAGGAARKADRVAARGEPDAGPPRKSTRLNSSHGSISYAVFCLKKKKQDNTTPTTTQYTSRT